MKVITIQKRLCERAGGVWKPNATGRGGTCAGGLCEKCGQPPGWRGLHPHEKPFKSHGGKLSMKSRMLCGKCHGGPDGHRTENIPHGNAVNKPVFEMSGYHPGHSYQKSDQTGIKPKSVRERK